METLQISKANAWKAFDGATTDGKTLLTDLFGKEVFSRKITDRVKTIEDALAITGMDTVRLQDSFIGLSKDEIAYIQLKLVAKALNEGWTPDWNNSGQYKYYPYFDMSNGFSYDGFGNNFQRSLVGSRLCFKSAELAKYAGTQFLHLYKDLFTL